MKDLFSLEGKNAIITGCNKGLGQAMALALAEAGANIAGLNRTAGEETKRLVEARGGRYLEIHCDLSEKQDWKVLIDRVLRGLGSVDILINNAGIIRRDESLDFTEEDWDQVMNVNLKSLFFLSQAAAGQMILEGEGGKIINIASMLSFQGGIRVPSYTASKSGVLGLTRLLANEWAARGISVNAIAPGYMVTDNTQALREDKGRYDSILERIPAGRWGEGSDLAGAVIFLSSRGSDYIHGQTLAVDGGWLAR